MKIATFNGENLYFLLDKNYSKDEIESMSPEALSKMSHSFFNKNKDIHKIKKICETINNENFDIIGLCEIGGKESLSNINKIYLNNQYDIFLEETNSVRGIYVGALFKKGLFDRVKVINHGNKHSFSRNLMQFTCFKDQQCVLTIFTLHLKSQNGNDNGIDQRYNEVKKITKLISKVKHQDKPIIVMGDFNGIAIKGHSQFEFDSFLSLPFKDVLDILNIPVDQRHTHYHFNDNKPNFHQLDYIFIQESFANIIDQDNSGVIPYKDPDGLKIEPISFDDRRKNFPSDHVFLKMSLKI